MIINNSNRLPNMQGIAGAAYIVYLAKPGLKAMEPLRHDTTLEAWLISLKDGQKIGYYALQMVRKAELDMARLQNVPYEGSTHQLDVYALDTEHDYDVNQLESLRWRVDWPITEPLTLKNAGEEAIKRITR